MSNVNTEIPEVTDINIPFPEATELKLVLAVGACKLRIVPGSSETWVSGTYTAPAGVMPLTIEQHDGTLRISQEIVLSTRMRTAPKFDLKLGTGRAYQLKFETGASDCDLDVGGLPLTDLVIRQGAGSLEMDFSSPNPEVMDRLKLESGATSVEMKRLSNAGFKRMSVEGGAGSYELDFSGTLKYDATLDLQLGASSVELEIPPTLATDIKADSVLGSVSIPGFARKGNQYRNRASLDESGPQLSVRAKMAVGSIAVHGG